jgi:hypothetical protein
MRYNMFVKQGGSSYGALVCSVCNKSVTLELDHQADVKRYGEGSRVLNVVGSPKPPIVERKKHEADTGLSDETL